MAAYGGKEEQLAKSMEALDISKKRPDIKAVSSPPRRREQLHHRSYTLVSMADSIEIV